jgi:hypothetical protein
MNTYLVAALAVVALVAGSSYATWSVTADYYRALEAKAVAQAVAVEAQRRAELATQVAALERKQQQVREVEVVKWRTIKKEVERVVQADPVYVRAECRVTDDGVRLYNAAANGLQLAAAAGQPAAVPVQPAAAETKRDPGRPAGDSGGGVRPVPRLPAGS